MNGSTEQPGLAVVSARSSVPSLLFEWDELQRPSGQHMAAVEEKWPFPSLKRKWSFSFRLEGLKN